MNVMIGNVDLQRNVKMVQIFKKQKAFLAPDVIISIIATDDKKANDILVQDQIKLVTSDFALYEAITSITKEELKLNKLSEFLFKVEVVNSPKVRDGIERIDHLRKVAKLPKLEK